MAERSAPIGAISSLRAIRCFRFTEIEGEPFHSMIYSKVRARMRLFSAKSKTGKFLSQSVFRAKLCAWKTSIDSSIQAQESGEVMRRKWRGYGNSYRNWGGDNLDKVSQGFLPSLKNLFM